MPDLVPIKVILKPVNDDGSARLDQHGKATVYPNFRNLPVLNGREPWEIIEGRDGRGGTGWHTDRVENLGTGAPNGVACACVPKDFADAAVTAGLAEKMTEAELEAHFDTRAYADQPEEWDDLETLTALQAKLDLLERTKPAGAAGNDVTARAEALKAEIRQALDPDNPRRGVRRNVNKRWADYKTKRNITVVP